MVMFSLKLLNTELIVDHRYDWSNSICATRLRTLDEWNYKFRYRLSGDIVLYRFARIHTFIFSKFYPEPSVS